MMQERQKLNFRGLVCELKNLELNSFWKEDPSRDFGHVRNIIISITVIIMCIAFYSFITISLLLYMVPGICCVQINM